MNKIIVILISIMFLMACSNMRIVRNSQDLYDAAVEGNPRSIVELINNDADVNFQDENGDIALMGAVHYKRLENVVTLLENGADPNIPNDYGWIPLQEAIQQAAVISRLRLQKALDIIEALLKHGADTEILNEKGHNLLLEVLLDPIMMPDVKADVAALLLKHGADPLAPANNKVTPALYAIYGGHTEIVVAMIKYGFDPTKILDCKKSAFEWARPDLRIVMEDAFASYNKNL